MVMMAEHEFVVSSFSAKFVIGWTTGLTLYALFIGYAEGRGREQTYKQLLAELAYGFLSKDARARHVRERNTN